MLMSSEQPVLLLGGVPAMEGLVGALAGLTVGLVAWVLVRSAGRRTESVRSLLSDAQRSLKREEARGGTLMVRMGSALAPIAGPLANRLPLESLKKSLSERYARAGWPGGFSDDEVMGLSILLGFLCLPLVAIALAIVDLRLAWLSPVLAVPTGTLVLSVVFNGQGNRRELSIARDMPYVMDMLVLMVHAGAHLRDAFRQVSDDYRGTHIGTEFRWILLDLKLMLTMKEAVENFQQRAPVPVVTTFVDNVIQSQETGQPIAETLRKLTGRVRSMRTRMALETAGKAKVQVLAPGILVLMAGLILLFGPFIMRALAERATL